MAKNEARETPGQGESVDIGKGRCHELAEAGGRKE